MLYTGAMSRNKRNARSTNSGPGRRVHFDEGRGAASQNGPGNNTYDLGNGNVIGITDSIKKSMSSNKPGFEWHPADRKAGVSAHHTYMEYSTNCTKCAKLEDQGTHPNGTGPYDDDGR
jgi:hypothetical protein